MVRTPSNATVRSNGEADLHRFTHARTAVFYLLLNVVGTDLLHESNWDTCMHLFSLEIGTEFLEVTSIKCAKVVFDFVRKSIYFFCL